MRIKANLAADGALIVTAMLWGSTFVVTKELLEHWPPITYLALRFTLASLLLAIIFYKKLISARAAQWKAGALLGLLIGAGLAVQSTGQIYTTPSKSAFITGLTTPLVPFVSLLLLKLRPGLENIIGVTLASVGGMLILAPSQGYANTGDLITLGCVLLFAFHITLLSLYTKRFDIGQLTVLQIISAAIFFILAFALLRGLAYVIPVAARPAVVQREVASLVVSAPVIGEFLYMTIIATIVTFLLWAWGQARMSATHAAIIFSLEPVFATLFAIAVRGTGEWLGRRGAIGAVLILCGVIVSELRIRDRRKSSAAVQDFDDPEISIAPSA